MTALDFAARHVIVACDIAAVIDGADAKQLWIRGCTPGGLDATVSWWSDASGVHVEQEGRTETVAWRALVDVIRRGVRDETRADLWRAMRVHSDVCMESPAAWKGWQSDPVAALNLKDHQERYSAAVAELNRIEADVITRGLARNEQMSLL